MSLTRWGSSEMAKGEAVKDSMDGGHQPIGGITGGIGGLDIGGAGSGGHDPGIRKKKSLVFLDRILVLIDDIDFFSGEETK